MRPTPACAALARHSPRRSAALPIECTALDRELLLVDWLNAPVFDMATRRMPFPRFEVDIDHSRLRAVA